VYEASLVCFVYSLWCTFYKCFSTGIRQTQSNPGRCRLIMFTIISMLLVSSLVFCFPLYLKQFSMPNTGLYSWCLLLSSRPVEISVPFTQWNSLVEPAG